MFLYLKALTTCMAPSLSTQTPSADPFCSLCPAPGAHLLPYLHAPSRWQPPLEATILSLVTTVPSLWLVIRTRGSESFLPVYPVDSQVKLWADLTVWCSRWEALPTFSWPNQKTIYIQAKALCSYQKLLDLTPSQQLCPLWATSVQELWNIFGLQTKKKPQMLADCKY